MTAEIISFRTRQVEQLLTRDEIQSRFNVSGNAWWRWRAVLPQPVKDARGRHRWRPSDVEAIVTAVREGAMIVPENKARFRWCPFARASEREEHASPTSAGASMPQPRLMRRQARPQYPSELSKLVRQASLRRR